MEVKFQTYDKTIQKKLFFLKKAFFNEWKYKKTSFWDNNENIDFIYQAI